MAGRDRLALSAVFLAAALAVAVHDAAPCNAKSLSPQVKLPLTLPTLPFADNALEPNIDARTMDVHRTRHNQASISALNALGNSTSAVLKVGLSQMCLGVGNSYVLPKDLWTAVRNNAGGAWNHQFWWPTLAPQGRNGNTTSKFNAAVNLAFGNFTGLKSAMAAAAAARFGSGWAWLCVAPQTNALIVTSTPNQDNPLMSYVVEQPCMPVLAVDVWEHAYYLAYLNQRPAYVNAWWNVINWERVSRNYEAALRGDVDGLIAP